MQITIKTILLSTLQRIASENNLSPENYASNIVKSFLEHQYRGEISDKLKSATVEELLVIKNTPLGNLQAKQIIIK